MTARHPHRACDTACHTATSPRTACTCPCGGDAHGSRRVLVAAVPARDPFRGIPMPPTDVEDQW